MSDSGHTTHHRTVVIDGLEIFYREAGPKDAPTILCVFRGNSITDSD